MSRGPRATPEATTAAREHLIELVELGNSVEELVPILNTSSGTLYRLYRGKGGPADQALTEAILKLPLAVHGNHELAEPTMRRLQALAAIGISQQAIADAAGVSRDTVQNIQHGKWRRAQLSWAAGVRKAYDAIVANPPEPDVRTRQAARRHGWPPPAAWTTEALDDPQSNRTERVRAQWIASKPVLTPGERLFDAREYHAWSQTEAGAKVGVSLHTWRAWETDRYSPRKQYLPKLKEVFDWEP